MVMMTRSYPLNTKDLENIMGTQNKHQSLGLARGCRTLFNLSTLGIMKIVGGVSVVGIIIVVHTN
jgi:hypothetical protein